jgi:hypothetical protein
MCDSKLACKGGLINGGKTMLFLGMIDSSNTMLLLPVAGGMINGRDTALLLSAGRRFGCLRATANQHARGGLINGSNMMHFLGMIDGGNTRLLLADADGLIDGRDTALLLLAG